MDVLRLGELRESPLRHFDHKLEIRAEKYEQLRGRTNVTSCRSLARDDGTAQFTHRLKERRQAEFLKRRSLSPQDFKKTRGSSSPETFSGSSCSPHNSLNTNYRQVTTTMMMMMMKEDEASFSLGDVTMERGTHETKHSANTSREEASIQTESGLVTVKESDVLQLQDYLQEALWREEAIKKKLEESTAQFLNSSNIIWKARCSEEVLRNRIKVLEVQLQACLQKFPKDATRKLVLQMKKQKVMYGEKTHKVTEEKHEAGQEALITAKVDVLKMQSLYEELKLTSENLRQQQDLRTDQLRQQQVQIELSRCREAALTEELVSQRQDMKELQFSMGLLEEYNQFLRDKQQNRGNVEKKDAMVQKSLEEEVKPEGVVMVERTLEEEEEKEEISKNNVDLEEQLLRTQEELSFKEKEFELLQTELRTMEQEFQSSQTRLSMCREELRQVSQRWDRPKRRVFWWNPLTMVVFLLLLLLAAGGVILLWLQHPPFREQVVDIYSHMEKQLEEHFMLRTSPKRPGCFRPF
ncbi:TRAF3-interacting JNK-activating modulator isoform X4 [Nerophis lumbriciformis]|uniref:TRAF3-interacting JNK-activating modulator isoform X4 n=1 Tax=Nerophis lumbriciformis TaxID=546530 RepID=UPI002ADF8394|nr:golgin subfamily A member 6-like protein 26 isoform X2 [Nerophis lumbriciformis]